VYPTAFLQSFVAQKIARLVGRETQKIQEILALIATQPG
jgi:hypothetical protein